MSNIDARSFLEAVSGFANESSGAKSSSERPVRLATIDPFYTSGLPTVIFDGEATATLKGYSWTNGYTPSAGDRVYLIPVGQSYIIGGKIASAMPYNKFIDIPLYAGWVAFDTNNYHAPKVTRTPTGMVHISGMMKGGTTTAATVFGVLPPPFRPLVPQSFMGMSNGQASGIDVLPNGHMKIGYGHVGGTGYSTLDNISYQTDPRLVWNEPGYLNGWQASIEGGFEAPTYTKDSLGRVWYRGRIMHTGSPAAETPALQVADGFRSYRQQHFVAYGASTFSNLDTNAAGLVGWKTNSGSPAWVNLSNIMHHEASVGNWTNVPAFQNGWTFYGPGQPDASWFKDSEGIVHLRGLVRSGAIGTTIFNLPPGHRPSKILLFAVNSTNATGRLDITPGGDVQALAGSNGYVSLDGIKFSAEQ